jgi:uncharacterized SAM-dependent methyltransferase
MNRVNILLKTSFEYLNLKLSSYDVINIVDIGTGNGFTTKPIIDNLIQNNKKVNYLGVDISSKMLEIVSFNLNNWYPLIKVNKLVADWLVCRLTFFAIFY